MFLSELGVESDDISEQTLRDLVASEIEETQRLEFKRELPPGTDENREFARDVCAMANGGGGLIVIGIGEESSRASSLHPTPIGDMPNRVTQVVRTRILPYVPLAVFQILSVDDSSTGYLLVVVGSSAQRPFATDESNGLGYWTRSGTSKLPMPESEVAEGYALRARRFHTAVDRSTELVDSVSGRLLGGAAAVFLVAVPTSERGRVFIPNRASSALLRTASLAVPPVMDDLYELGVVLFEDMNPGFRRLNNAIRWSSDSPPEDRGWQEFHGDGSFLGVVRGDSHPLTFAGPYIPEDVEGLPGFQNTTLVVEFTSRLRAFLLFADTFNISGEVRLVSGVRLVTSPIALSAGRHQRNPDTAIPLRSDVRTDLSVELEMLRHPQSLVSTVKILLDDIFSGFGWPECPQISESGALRLDRWDSYFRDSVARWANDNEIDVEAEASG